MTQRSVGLLCDATSPAAKTLDMGMLVWWEDGGGAGGGVDGENG